MRERESHIGLISIEIITKIFLLGTKNMNEQLKWFILVVFIKIWMNLWMNEWMNETLIIYNNSI